MKKILIFIFLLITCFLAGCGNNTTAKQVIAEIQKSIDQNDAQVQIAFGNDLESKEDLIKSLELHSDGLMALCINPEPMDLKNYEVREYFMNAIGRTGLTLEQKNQIAKIGEYTYTRALLLTGNLDGNILVTVCENPGIEDLDNSEIYYLFKNAMKRTELTTEQEIQIAEIGEPVYTRALLTSENLTGDALVAICKNPVGIDFNDYDLQESFKIAIWGTRLTAEQEVKIAKIGKSIYAQGLLLRKNLTGDGLVAVCENPGSMNMDNHKEDFKKSIKRTELTAEQKAQIAKSKVGRIGLF